MTTAPLHKSLSVDVARHFPGGCGEGVRVAVVEYGFEEGHSDLDGVEILGSESDNPDFVRHGTMSLGVLGARPDDDDRVEGICPHSKLYGVAYAGAPVQVGIQIARRVLRPGDILLLEAQSAKKGPVEEWPPTFRVIKDAVDAGIIVVEAAGNGGWNLRDIQWNGDSGAILVGSTHMTSCRGERIDVIGPGFGVVSTRSGDSFTNSFNGTSSASAVVAGVCALMQGLLLAGGEVPIGPAGMRLNLRNLRDDLGNINGVLDRWLRRRKDCADLDLDGRVGWGDLRAAIGSWDKLKRWKRQWGNRWPEDYT